MPLNHFINMDLCNIYIFESRSDTKTRIQVVFMFFFRNLFTGIVKGELWFEYRPRLCTAVASICVMSCFCSLLSIMAISINRYVHICKNQVVTLPFFINTTL